MSNDLTHRGMVAVLDMEASGFGKNSYPIEVGYVLADGSSFCTLIKPEPDWTHWDEQAEQTHHISRIIAQQHGQDARTVAQKLNTALAGLTLYSDGWANDYSWLGKLFDTADLSPHFKLDNLRSLLTDEEAQRWHAVKQEVAQEAGLDRHRASADAKLLQLTLMRLKRG
ncbi:MAG: hypothetical protein ACKOF9_14250 [Burkholderiales bacterium]